MWMNLSSQRDTRELSDIVSRAWNDVSLANLNGVVPDGAVSSRPLGEFQCPPGSVFEIGTREATLQWREGGAVSGFFSGLLPTEERFYQVQTQSTPFTPERPVQSTATGLLASITTSPVLDSNVSQAIGTSTNQYNIPTATDVRNAAHAAGEAVSRSLTDVVSGATGMNSSDIKFIAYGTLGIIGALVFVKILKEVKAI